MSAEVVGPVPSVRFLDGSTLAYDVPVNTCDERAGRCKDHHVACDCRESMFAEDTHEYRAAMDDAKNVMAHLLDSPCPPHRRHDCTYCRAALGTWLGRYGSMRRSTVPF